MADVPNALDDCFWQSMQWQWKSMMGVLVGVVYLTAPQAQEPFMMESTDRPNGLEVIQLDDVG